MPPRRRKSKWVETFLAASMAGLLMAALLPRVVQVRRAPGERTLHATRTDFVSSLGAIHGEWLTTGSASLQIEWQGRRIQLTDDGWPTLDARDPAQDTASELYVLVTGRPLPAGFEAREDDRPGVLVATFVLEGPGGGAFSYDPATGRVYQPE